MKFRCERDSLVEVLTTAGRAVSSRTSTSMALGGLRIESQDNQLSQVRGLMLNRLKTLWA